MNTAILIDWEQYRSDPVVQSFVNARANKENSPRVILAVPYPDLRDYEYQANHPEDPYDIQWDMVVRNSGGLPVVEFFEKVLTLLRDVGDTQVPVLLSRAWHPSGYMNYGVWVTSYNLGMTEIK